MAPDLGEPSCARRSVCGCHLREKRVDMTIFPQKRVKCSAMTCAHAPLIHLATLSLGKKVKLPFKK